MRVSTEGEPESGVQNGRDSRDFAHARKPEMIQFYPRTVTALDLELIIVWNCLFFFLSGGGGDAEDGRPWLAAGSELRGEHLPSLWDVTAGGKASDKQPVGGFTKCSRETAVAFVVKVYDHLKSRKGGRLDK